MLSLFGWVDVVNGSCYALLSGLSLLQSSGQGRIADCFTLIVFLLALFLVFGALCLFLTVSWVGLQCVIVAFPGHTYLFLGTLHMFVFSFLFNLLNYRNHCSFTLVMIDFNCHFLVTRTEYDNHTSNIVKWFSCNTKYTGEHHCC